MKLKNSKQFYPKKIPLQIRSLGTRAFFVRQHTKIIVEILVFLIQLKNSSVVMHQGK